jgi:hypothetical protein
VLCLQRGWTCIFTASVASGLVVEGANLTATILQWTIMGVKNKCINK